MTPTGPSPAKRRRIVFVVTEDWFFASHFLPMARAAREAGAEVAVVTRVRAHREVIEAAGVRVVALEAERRSLNPMKAGYAAGRLAAILKDERADLVHCIALRSILLGGAAAVLAGIPRRVYALTGLGFLGARRDPVGRAGLAAIRLLLRGPLQSRATVFLFENPDDPRLLGLDPADAGRVAIVGGAGIDPDLFTPAPLPPAPPLRIAIVSRMLWSKGIDVAVEAVRLARGRGAALELSLYGAPDRSNPRSVSEATLQDWSREPGIAWLGRAADVPALWAAHQVCCLPSRGGEGLPRSLLEGAACGRAIVTSDVPGCRTLVRDGREGLLVPPGDAAALARAFERLAQDHDLVLRLGEAARARVLDGFTEHDVGEAVLALYRRLLEADA